MAAAIRLRYVATLILNSPVPIEEVREILLVSCAQLRLADSFKLSARLQELIGTLFNGDAEFNDLENSLYPNA